MKKIIDYITKGSGFGILPLLAFSVVIAIIISIKMKDFSNSMIPAAQETANRILPVKIEHGRVITPDNINQTFKIKLSDRFPDVRIPFVVNTTVDTLNPVRLKEGIYLTRTAFYTVGKNQTKVMALSDSLDIPQGDYTDFFKDVANYVIAFMFSFFVIIFFIGLLLACLFYTLTAWLLSAVMKRQTGFDFRMRLSSCGVIMIYTLSFLLTLSGSSLSGMVFFILVLAFQGLFIYHAPQK